MWKPLWAKSLAPKVVDDESRVVADSQGDFIWAGTLRDLSLCGEHGGKDFDDHVFVAKLKADGSPMWLTEFTGGDHGILDVAVLGDRIAVGGYFDGSLDFGGATLATASGGHDSFVAVLDSEGAPLWARSAGPGVGNVDGVALDPLGGVTMTGTFQDTVDWGTGPLTSVEVTDFYVVKLDPSGAPVWVRAFGGAGLQYGLAIARGASGDVALVGVSDAGFELGGEVLTKYQGFLLKLDDVTGEDIWGRLTPDFPMRITPAPAGGYFTSSASLNDQPRLSKYDEDGEFVFDHQFEGSVVENSGASKPVIFGDRVAVSYGVIGTVDLGGGDLASAGADDVVIGVFDLDGGFVSSMSFGHAKFVVPWSLAVSGHRMVLTGALQGPLDVGFTTIPADPFDHSFWMLALADDTD